MGYLSVRANQEGYTLFSDHVFLQVGLTPIISHEILQYTYMGQGDDDGHTSRGIRDRLCSDDYSGYPQEGIQNFHHLPLSVSYLPTMKGCKSANFAL